MNLPRSTGHGQGRPAARTARARSEENDAMERDADENEMKQLFFSIKLLRVYRGLYQKREHPADPPT